MTLQTSAAPQAGNQGPEYLTTSEAAAIIRTDPDYVARQCANGNLPAKKVGKEWRVHRDDLETFMRGGRAKAPPARPRAKVAPAGASRKRAR